MKKLALFVVSTFLLLMMPQATAANQVIRITAPLYQTFTGEFRNDGLARSFMERGPPYEVIIRLERDPATSSGYRWTSGKGVSVVLTSGTTLTADVTIEFRRPIEMVIPALRDLLNL